MLGHGVSIDRIDQVSKEANHEPVGGQFVPHIGANSLSVDSIGSNIFLQLRLDVI
jgi:hypothetical protein